MESEPSRELAIDRLEEDESSCVDND